MSTMSTGPYSPFYDHHRWLFPSVDMTGSPVGTHVGHFNQTAMIGASISACSYCTLLPTICYYCLVPLWSKDKDKDQKPKKPPTTTEPPTLVLVRKHIRGQVQFAQYCVLRSLADVESGR
ncbi:hypothetical protein O988_09899 [Pseudogymnoascus sp. VKM F-3808]|nr:hypothetical protein O988_09899 [Pseudogymnoascus sp. VKM F-3808]